MRRWGEEGPCISPKTLRVKDESQIHFNKKKQGRGEATNERPEPATFLFLPFLPSTTVPNPMTCWDRSFRKLSDDSILILNDGGNTSVRRELSLILGGEEGDGGGVSFELSSLKGDGGGELSDGCCLKASLLLELFDLEEDLVHPVFRCWRLEGEETRETKRRRDDLNPSCFVSNLHHTFLPSLTSSQPCLQETLLERTDTGRDQEIETTTEEDPLDETTGTGRGRGRLHREGRGTEAEAGTEKETAETIGGVERRTREEREAGVGVEVEIGTTRRGGSTEGGHLQSQLQNQSKSLVSSPSSSLSAYMASRGACS